MHDFNFKKCLIDKSDDIVNKYNNTYHRTIKMKPVDVKTNKYIDKDPEVKVVILLEYQNIKIFLEKVYTPICQWKFLWLKKLKMLFRGHILLMIVTKKKLLELFTRKNSEKSNYKKFRIEKVIKRKSNQLYGKRLNKWIK